MSSQSAILVVDDEKPVCAGCRRLLTREGYKVECSTDPVEGLRMAEGRQYDAVLLDIKMPELDGLSILDRLHRKKPALPVIMITGYPSVESASETMRLGAQDFVTKPFTPEQIRNSIKRALAGQPADDRGSTAGDGGANPTEQSSDTARPSTAEGDRSAAQAQSTWCPASDDYLFYCEAWLRLGWDGTAQVGAFLPRPRETPIESVVLPSVGDTVYQGLPLAVIKLADSHAWRLPSPLTGEVLEVHKTLERTAAESWARPYGGMWIARIRPRRMAEDLLACAPREALLVAADDEQRQTQQDLLAKLGCRVRTASTARAALNELSDRGCRVLLLDAATFGRKGPKIVRRIHTAHPEVKVIVLATHDYRWERAYCGSGMHYYAAEPFASGRINDILFAAFHSPEPRAALKPDVGSGNKWMHGIRLTSAPGSLVRLQVYDGSLLAEEGVGLFLRGRILAGGHRLETLRGNEPMAFDVSHVIGKLQGEAGRCKRLVILRAEDTGAIPGTLTVDNERAPAGLAERLGKTVITLVVQPEKHGKPLGFGARTNNALAEHILEVMTSP